MSLARAFSVVSFNTVISRIFGFIRDILMAGILGASVVSDAFFIALKLPNIFRRIFGEGALSIAFLPLYTEFQTSEGKEEASEFASLTLSNLLLILIPLTLIGIFLMPYLLKVIAPGYLDDPIQQERTVLFARLAFPYLLFISITALFGSLLNAHKNFVAFSFAPVLFNLTLIGALLLTYFFDIKGMIGEILSLSVVISGILQCGFLYVWLRIEKIQIQIIRPKITLKIKRLIKLVIPGIIGFGTAQGQIFVDVIIASFLPYGSISYLYYADRLNQLPLAIIGIAMSTALLPYLSKAIANKNVKQAKLYFAKSVEVSLLLVLPAAIALIMIPDMIITVLFQRGAFSADAAIATSQALAAYAIGLPAYILIKCYSNVFYAHQNTKTPVIITFCVMLLSIGLSIILIQYIAHVGIALATGLTAWISVRFLAFYAYKKYRYKIEKASWIQIFKLLLVNGIIVGLLYLFKNIAMQFEITNLMVGILVLSILILSIILIYTMMIVSFKIFDMNELKVIFKKKKKRVK